MSRYLGFDGFRSGWVAAWIDDRGSHGFDYSPKIDRLLRLQHDRAMIDIPVGLPDYDIRECDQVARSWLGSSVFAGIRRSVLKFSRLDEANDYYQSRNEPKISYQLWGLVEKIREIDNIMTADRQKNLCETHPELVFWSRFKKKPLEKKKSEVGRQQRIEILKRHGFEKIEQWLGWRYGTGIGRDDLIDACACAIAARDAKDVIGSDKRDAKGLRMEMYY